MWPSQWRAGHQYIVGGLANRAFCYRIIGASQPGASTVHALIAPAREPNLSREIAHKRPNHLKLQLREGLEAPSPQRGPGDEGAWKALSAGETHPAFAAHAGQIGGQGAEGARETYGRAERPLLRPTGSATGPPAKA